MFQKPQSKTKTLILLSITILYLLTSVSFIFVALSPCINCCHLDLESPCSNATGQVSCDPSKECFLMSGDRREGGCACMTGSCDYTLYDSSCDIINDSYSENCPCYTRRNQFLYNISFIIVMFTALSCLPFAALTVGQPVYNRLFESEICLGKQLCLPNNNWDFYQGKYICIHIILDYAFVLHGFNLIRHTETYLSYCNTYKALEVWWSKR